MNRQLDMMKQWAKFKSIQYHELVGESESAHFIYGEDSAEYREALDREFKVWDTFQKAQSAIDKFEKETQA